MHVSSMYYGSEYAARIIVRGVHSRCQYSTRQNPSVVLASRPCPECDHARSIVTGLLFHMIHVFHMQAIFISCYGNHRCRAFDLPTQHTPVVTLLCRTTIASKQSGVTSAHYNHVCVHNNCPLHYSCSWQGTSPLGRITLLPAASRMDGLLW